MRARVGKWVRGCARMFYDLFCHKKILLVVFPVCGVMVPPDINKGSEAQGGSTYLPSDMQPKGCIEHIRCCLLSALFVL